MKLISRQSLLALLLSLLLVPSLWAQGEAKESFSQSLSIGVHGGIVASRFTFVPSVRQRIHVGYVGGLALRYDIERGASLQMEFNYLRGGWQEKYDALATRYTRHIDYLELPILSHLYFRSGGTRLFLNLGPFVGYQLAESSEVLGEANMSERDLARHQMAVTDRLFWGLGGGPGVSIALGARQRIELEGRFVYGLGNIWSARRGSAYVQSSEIRFGATLNYFFRL